MATERINPEVVGGHATFCEVVVDGVLVRLRCTSGSFDEIVVTMVTARAECADPAHLDLQPPFPPNRAPVMNVAAAVLIPLSGVPIYLAQRLSADTVATHR
jgi:hypothetical protein